MVGVCRRLWHAGCVLQLALSVGNVILTLVMIPLGETADYAWKEFSRAKKGETVFVTAGAGRCFDAA